MKRKGINTGTTSRRNEGYLAEGCRLYGSTELEVDAYWNSNNVHIMEQHL